MEIVQKTPSLGSPAGIITGMLITGIALVVFSRIAMTRQLMGLNPGVTPASLKAA
jgi:hypothetical protein